jgi:predicted RNA methylase
LESLTEKCKRLEFYETDLWAARAILKREILTRVVIDPCCGHGVLGDAAFEAGYEVIYYDIEDWGHEHTNICDFLNPSENIKRSVPENTILMNPPFSKAVEFVEQAFALGARKIVVFQRFSWWESAERMEFWARMNPNRTYACGDRATCWRADLPKDEAGSRFDPDTGKKLAGSSTAHAFFVFEKGHPPGNLLGHIRKADLA